MKYKNPLPKLSLLQDELPEHVQEYMYLTRLAEMGRMSGVVAHEINNPLMVVQGFAENIEIMLEDDGNISREDIKIQIAEIIKACQRMADIVSKMHRPSHGNKLCLHAVDLTDVVSSALEKIKTQLPQLNVKLDVNLDKPMPIKCDVAQVEQMVLNILGNALKALQNVENGRVLRISFTEAGPWQQVKLWNNGPAIPEDAQNKILRGGSSLGLVVSKAIMEVHGGDLSFSSNDDKGTEFILSFPRAA